MSQTPTGRPRCVVLDDWQAVALDHADWSPVADRLDVQVRHDHLASADAVVEALAGATVVVAMRERTPLPREVLERLPDLRLLVTTGMVNASIDLDAAREQGVVVCGTRGLTTPTVELTWALVLGLARRLHVETRHLREAGPWQSTVGTDLHGATLGLLGLGRLGGEVARIGLAFGMDVVAWSANLTDERCAEVGVRRAQGLDDLLAGSDVVSVHLVLGDRTRGLIGPRELALMRPSALLVNTSRAPIVEEAALVEALRSDRIAGAALDVHEAEPLPADHPLRTLPNVLATPHLGYVTAANYRTYFTDVVEDVASWLDGAAPVRRLA